MSWFDEQLRTRKEADDSGLEESIDSIAPLWIKRSRRGLWQRKS